MKDPKKILFRGSTNPQGLAKVKGYDFSKQFSINSFLSSYETTGFQASELAKAVKILKQMKKAKATIFLGYTSNLVSSGLREVIAYLVQNKLVDVLVTTAGGVEEDIIKTLNPFLVGEFQTDDVELRKQGVNRIGNIMIPNDRYVAFEKFMSKFFEKVYKGKKQVSCSEFVKELGKAVKDKNSIYYWAAKNNIPVFCPALTDGSIGDMLYFYKKKHPEISLDISQDIITITDIALNAEKTGVIALGGGLPKHHVINANLFRDGADYAVYVCTGSEGDGSVGGARPREGVSWGKLRAEATTAHIEGDASIVFPLLVLGWTNKG